MIETKEYENQLNCKRKELKKTRKDLWYESNYNDTLKFMVSRTRDLVKVAGIPINTKNDELFRINIERKTESREIKQI